MQDVSAFGFVATLIASVTFPTGFGLSAFADDTDPFDLPDIKVGDTASGLNGDLIAWSKATPLNVTIGVIPGSIDDANLSALLEANRVGKGKNSARDIITITAVYPSGNVLILSNGKIQSGSMGSSVASSGRLKTKPFMFAFESRSGVGA